MAIQEAGSNPVRSNSCIRASGVAYREKGAGRGRLETASLANAAKKTKGSGQSCSSRKSYSGRPSWQLRQRNAAQEFRFAGQPQDEIADQIVGSLRRLAAGPEAEEHAGDDRAMGTHDSESQESRSTLRVERVARLSESCVPHAHQSAEPPACRCTSSLGENKSNPVRTENLTRNCQVDSYGSGTRRKQPRGSRWKDPRSAKRHVSPNDRDRGPDEIGCFAAPCRLSSSKWSHECRFAGQS